MRYASSIPCDAVIYDLDRLSVILPIRRYRTGRVPELVVEDKLVRACVSATTDSNGAGGTILRR